MLPGDFTPYGDYVPDPPFKTYLFKNITDTPKSPEGKFPGNYSGVYSGDCKPWVPTLSMDVYLPENRTKHVLNCQASY